MSNADLVPPPRRTDASWPEGPIRTAARLMTTIAVGLMAAGAVLLAAGFVMVITQRPHTGVNFGGDGAFFFGLGATAGGGGAC